MVYLGPHSETRTASWERRGGWPGCPPLLQLPYASIGHLLPQATPPPHPPRVFPTIPTHTDTHSYLEPHIYQRGGQT